MSHATTPHRSVRIPSLMRLVRGIDATLDALEEATGPRASVLVVHSAASSGTGYGQAVAAGSRARGMRTADAVTLRNDETSVAAVVEAVAAARPDFVVGVGGGRVVDVAKLAAARADVEVVSIPTQLASDAICSPVAVIVDPAGRLQSVGARMPAAIVVDLDIVDRAPPSTWLAGLGDLTSNVSAVRDWRIAHEQRGEDFDDFACLTSEAAALSVIEDDADLGDPDYRQKLTRGLILSGIAMEMAGSSRPASGSEHLISHALDRILAEPRAHGLQVSVATIASGLLRGEDVARLVRFHRRVGLPVVPGDLGISMDDFLAAVRIGPETRPGRTSILDELAEARVDALRAQLEAIAGSGVAVPGA